MSSSGSSQTLIEEMRIVMVGKSGAGKSATGNTILGRECFVSEVSPTSVTEECSKSKAVVSGQQVSVIDTPGFFDTRFDKEKTTADVTQCISYASPGPHIFLVVIKLGRYTDEEKKTVEEIQAVFGQAADKYSMVLFTGGDTLIRSSIEDFIAKSPDLQELVARCNHQYHVFNNNIDDPSQVTELFQKIRNIVQKNRGSHYTTEMFEEAERVIKEEQERKLKEKEQEIRREKEDVEKQVKAEFDEKFQKIMEQIQAEKEKERKMEEMNAERRWEIEDVMAELRRVREESERELARIKDMYERELRERKNDVQMRYVTQAREETENSNPLLLLVKAGINVFKAVKGFMARFHP